jgi:subtilisin-like proprotein convertase family protein
MGSGNHLNSGRTPAPPCAYLRDLVGWTTHEVSLAQAGSMELKHGDYTTLYKFPTPNPSEYFLMENRSRQGLDLFLPSSGLAIYHCDRNGSNEWQAGTAGRHYQCALLQADGRRDLENDIRPDATDLFGETPNVALNDVSNPSSRLWDGSDSGLVISQISAPGEVIGFRVGEEIAIAANGGSATPDLLIPDNNPEGSTSAITVSRHGEVAGITVKLSITHTYIGDLQVNLVAPGRNKAVLHNRTGETADDLIATYHSETTSTLTTLLGGPSQGDWTLEVKDLAGRDVGRLNEWSLELDITDNHDVEEVSASPNLAIPDNHSVGISDTINIAKTGKLVDIEVSVAIVHPFIGDLSVELLSPAGSSVVLHDNTGANQDNINTTYTAVSTPRLELLRGEPIKGDWRLRVRDLQGDDTGHLKTWSVKLTY